MSWRATPIAVLYGGPSSEREISLLSGRAVHEALAEKGLRAELVDVRGPADVESLKAKGAGLAFVALHGRFGEDGGVQAILERQGLAYTGSGPEACRRAMDKTVSRRLFAEAGLAVPRGEVVRQGGRAGTGDLRYPLFVKPASSGSSIGVSLVRRPEELGAALEAAFREDPTALVEERIEGRELTVGILGEEAMPAIEIIPAREFFDYTAKYGEAGTRYEEPRGLDAGTLAELGRAALAAHRALGCAGFSRVDFMLAGSEAYVLEVNAIPGLTRKSLVPKMAAKMGIAFPDLCVRIIEESLRSRRPQGIRP